MYKSSILLDCSVSRLDARLLEVCGISAAKLINTPIIYVNMSITQHSRLTPLIVCNPLHSYFTEWFCKKPIVPEHGNELYTENDTLYAS